MLEKIADAGVRDRLEVRCRMRRGAAAIAARGWGADEAIEDFTCSAELCRRLGPRPEYVAAMTGVYAYYLIQGELRAARQRRPGAPWPLAGARTRRSRPGPDRSAPR